jgi:hypothetical protein
MTGGNRGGDGKRGGMKVAKQWGAGRKPGKGGMHERERGGRRKASFFVAGSGQPTQPARRLTFRDF